MSRAIAILGAILASAIITQASNWDETPGVFFARDRGQAVKPFGELPRRISRGDASALIAAEAVKQGVPVRLALKVGKVESGNRCNAVGPQTKHGRHYGPFQIRGSSAARFGYRGGSLNNCGQGLYYGMAHLADCYRRAAGNEARAAACHVGGPGMASGPRGKYANQYVRQVAAANPSPPPAWAGRLQIAWNQ